MFVLICILVISLKVLFIVHQKNITPQYSSFCRTLELCHKFHPQFQMNHISPQNLPHWEVYEEQ